MIKSVKGQLIFSIITASLFVIASFSFIEFTENEGFLFGPIVYYFIMIFAVYNAGLLTQKYILTIFNRPNKRIALNNLKTLSLDRNITEYGGNETGYKLTKNRQKKGDVS